MWAAAAGIAALLLGGAVAASSKGSPHEPSRVLRVAGLEVVAAAVPTAEPGVRTFDLSLEAVSELAQARLKGRSARLRLSVRCDAALFKAANFRVYAGARGTGAQEEVALPDEWLRGERGSDLPALGSALCADGGASPADATGPDEGPPGWAVQLGSFPSAQAARAAWSRLSKPLDRRSLAPPGIERAQVRGADVYRLVVAVKDRASARALCVQVRAKAGTCLPRPPVSPRPSGASGAASD